MPSFPSTGARSVPTGAAREPIAASVSSSVAGTFRTLFWETSLNEAASQASMEARRRRASGVLLRPLFIVAADCCVGKLTGRAGSKNTVRRCADREGASKVTGKCRRGRCAVGRSCEIENRNVEVSFQRGSLNSHSGGHQSQRILGSLVWILSPDFRCLVRSTLYAMYLTKFGQYSRMEAFSSPAVMSISSVNNNQQLSENATNKSKLPLPNPDLPILNTFPETKAG